MRDDRHGVRVGSGGNPTCRRARRQGGSTVEYVAGTVATPVILKPRMRGVLHQWACVASVVLGVLVVVFADGGRENVAGRSTRRA